MFKGQPEALDGLYITQLGAKMRKPLFKLQIKKSLASIVVTSIFMSTLLHQIILIISYDLTYIRPILNQNSK